MNDDRFAQRMDHFYKAVDALRLALERPEDEFIRDSIIKRFELGFETARKVLHQWLVEQQEISGSATKKEVMEAAFRTALIVDVDLWNEMLAYRNDVSHGYDKGKAMVLVAFVRRRGAAAFDALKQALLTR